MEPIGEAASIDVDIGDQEKPVVGVVADSGPPDALARVVLRASQRGHSVLVSCPESVADDYEFLDGTDSVVRVSMVDAGRRDDLERRLRNVARSLGFPGMLYHRRPAEYIDYERSVAALGDSNDYAVRTVTKPRLDWDESAGVLVAIPAYNEGDTIATVVRGVREYADNVLVVDDGSDDDTVAEAEAAGALVVEHERNRGYGAALKTAFAEAEQRGVDHLAVLDADGQHDPADIPRLVDRARESAADLVIGSRFVDDAPVEAPLYRRLGLHAVNLLTNLSLGVVRSEFRVADTQSGFRVYSRRAVETLATDDSIGDRMSASTDILYHAHHHDYAIEEVGVRIEYGEGTESSHHPLAHGFVLVTNILKTVEHERPISLLGAPGFASSFVGIGLAYWVFWQYLRTDAFLGGYAFLSVFLTLVGILACFTSIILHSLNLQFEHGRYQ